MRRLSTSLLAAAAVLLPVLSIAGHEDNDLGSAVRGQEVVVTGHAVPDPALHIEALSGTIDVHCLGCILDKRQSSETAGAGTVSSPQTVGSCGRIEVIARGLLELPAYRSPRAPPIA